MKALSELKTIKCIQKRWYKVELFEDRKGIYHVVANNTIAGTERIVSLVDFNMANFAFQVKINLFEGV